MAAHERICLKTADGKQFIGTVLYMGPVPPTSGDWLGVEWDDPSRGKHDGMHKETGVRYFTCRCPNSGSFIRPNAAGLTRGRSLRAAVHDKYQPDQVEVARDVGQYDEAAATPASGGSTFYATESNFRVEVVPLDRVGARFRQLERLREVGLEWEGVNGPGSEEEHAQLVQELASLETLHLSYSLLPSFRAAAEAVNGFSKLRNLSLNSNRFQRLMAPAHVHGLEAITALNLNHTLIDWEQIIYLSSSLPALKELQIGGNDINMLSTDVVSGVTLPNLETLNLSDNRIADWSNLEDTLAPLPSLRNLVLSSNAIVEIPSSTSASRRSKLNLRHLSLTDNVISSWSSISRLDTEHPGLEQVWLRGNTLFQDKAEADVRLEVIARMGNITQLEGSRITASEREDAELWYLGRISKEDIDDSEQELNHPRWRHLCKKYERVAAPAPMTSSTSHSSKSRLIKLHVRLVDPEQVDSLPNLSTTLSVLPMMKTMVFRTQVAKALFGPGKPLPKTKWRLIALLQPAADGSAAVFDSERELLGVNIPPNEEGRDLDWWGLQDGDQVVVEKYEARWRW